MSLFVRRGLASIGLLAIALPAAAQEPLPPRRISELLPVSEHAALVVGDTERLKARGDDLIDAVGVPMQYRLTYWVESGVQWLGVKAVYDPRAPVGVILNGRKGGDDQPARDFFESLVIAVPSREPIPKIDPADDDKPQNKVKPRRSYPEFDDRYLYIADFAPPANRDAIAAMLRDPKLERALTEEMRRHVDAADIVFHMGIERLRADKPKGFNGEWKWTQPKNLEPDEEPVAERIGVALEAAEHGLFCMSLEDGVVTRTAIQFRGAEGSEPRRLLDELRGADGVAPAVARPPTLQGLPDGPVLAAGTTRLTQARQQLLLRTVVKLFFSKEQYTGSGLTSIWRLGRVTDARQALVLGALAEVLPLAREARFAIYPIGDGHFTTVVVLESDDPQRIVASIRELSDLLVEQRDGGERGATGALTESQVQDLIAQLAADDLAARNRAATRLLVQGDKSLAWLDKAAQSNDPETARRVKLLMAKLQNSTQQRTERLIGDNPLVSAHPRLTYHAAEESVAGASVDVIHVDLPSAETEQAEPLTEMFGTEWDRVRIVQLPRHVVLTFGAPGPWLPATIDNLQHNRPGLAYSPRLVQLADDPDRLLQLHFPLSRLTPESKFRSFPSGEPKNMSPSVGLTGVGLSATATELWLDVHLPAEEVRGLVVKNGWYW